MRAVFAALIVAVWPAVFPSYLPAQSKPTLPIQKIKIEATALDRQMLLEKLNANGKDHNLKFALADQDYDYRIGFGTGQGTVITQYGEMNASEATTSVFDSKGTLLFEFKRAGRVTDSGATNAVAKEIIKRILKLRTP